MTKPSAKQMAQLIAQRTLNNVPNELICRELNIAPSTLSNIRTQPTYKNHFALISQNAAEMALAEVYLSQDEIKREAAASFRTLTNIRDEAAATPDDKAAARLAFDVAKWILETAGFSKVQKSVSLDAKSAIPPEVASEILKALSGDIPSEDHSAIIDIPLSVMKELPPETVIDASIVHNTQELNYGSAGARHKPDSSSTAEQELGEDPSSSKAD